jgi:flagellar protein FlgJ
MVDSTFFQTDPVSAERVSTSHSPLDNDPQKLKQACSDFESLFVYYLVKEMRATVPKSGLFSGGSAEEAYTSMMDIQLSKDIAEKRGIGISDALFKRLCNDVEKKQE